MRVLCIGRLEGWELLEEFGQVDVIDYGADYDPGRFDWIVLSSDVPIHTVKLKNGLTTETDAPYGARHNWDFREETYLSSGYVQLAVVSRVFSPEGLISAVRRPPQRGFFRIADTTQEQGLIPEDWAYRTWREFDSGYWVEGGVFQGERTKKICLEYINKPINCLIAEGHGGPAFQSELTYSDFDTVLTPPSVILFGGCNTGHPTQKYSIIGHPMKRNNCIPQLMAGFGMPTCTNFYTTASPDLYTALKRHNKVFGLAWLDMVNGDKNHWIYMSGMGNYPSPFMALHINLVGYPFVIMEG